jgi:two-component system chemotaxis response regulator CheY
MIDVLIVDDSAAIRKILQRVLRQTDMAIGQIIEAADGKEALDAFRSQQFGLVLSDINMPNMDGLELLAQLKSVEDTKRVPVVMITTEAN